MTLLLTEPGSSGKTSNSLSILAIKELTAGLVQKLGDFMIDRMSEPMNLSVQPPLLMNRLLGRQVLIMAYADDGQLTVFSDRVVGLDGLNLHLQDRGLIPVASIHEFVLLADDDSPAATCDLGSPIPLVPTAGVALMDLPRLFGRKVQVWAQGTGETVYAFSDVIHSWSGGSISFRNRRPPIPLAHIMHILPLEDIGAPTSTESGLPEYDPEPIDRSIP